MKIIDNAQARDVTINAAVRKGNTWNPAGEVYPIVLGWGAKLSAPGVYFYDANKNAEIIDVAAFSKSDTIGYASLVGNGDLPGRLIEASTSSGNRPTTRPPCRSNRATRSTWRTRT